MKRTQLLKLIAKAAKDSGIVWGQADTDGPHEKWLLGATVTIPVPRHTEINEITAQKILKLTEPELGKRWWK